jgi:hypothetical protein
VCDPARPAEDDLVTRSAALVLLTAALAAAAPVPKLTPKTFDGFGTLVETKGVTCETPKAGELRVSLSKEAAAASATHKQARPLVARAVEGDFELTVRITHAPPDGQDLTVVGRGDPDASAGIALQSADDPKTSLVLLARQCKEDGTWVSRFSMFSRFGDGKKGSDGGTVDEKLIVRPVYLRLTRRGDDFTAARSVDGKKWSSAVGSAFEVPGVAAVLVGPVAAHNANAQYDVTFDEYTLTTPAEKKK